MSDSPPRWYHRLFVGAQYLLPHHLLSGLMYRAARVRWSPLKELAIGIFVRRFGVDATEARTGDPSAYESFNDFFTRSLRPGVRPVAVEEDAVVSPVDGTLSQLGTVRNGRIFQAKGRAFSLLELLGGREDWARRLDGGSFATIYLGPRDYHRVHMPLEGTLRETVPIPGRLFSVNPTTTALVPRLFARNERVLCLFDTGIGPMAVVLVGAIFVGSIETRWAGRILPRGRDAPRWSNGGDQVVRLPKGAEMGRFNMGSTVIVLFAPDRVAWGPGLKPGERLRMGQKIGRARPSRPDAGRRPHGSAP